MATPKASARAQLRVDLPEPAPMPIVPTPLPVDADWLDIIRHAERRYREDDRRQEIACALFNEIDIDIHGKEAPPEASVLRDAREARWGVTIADVEASSLRFVDALAVGLYGDKAVQSVGFYGMSRAVFAGDCLYVLAGWEDEIPGPRCTGCRDDARPRRRAMLFRLPLDRVHTLDGGPTRP